MLFGFLQWHFFRQTTQRQRLLGAVVCESRTRSDWRNFSQCSDTENTKQQSKIDGDWCLVKYPFLSSIISVTVRLT